MALDAVIDSLDGLPAGIAEHYVEVDGQYRLDVTSKDGLSLENVDGLRTALSKERQGRRDAEGRLKLFADLDPEEARKAMETLEGLGDLEKLKDGDKVKQSYESQIEQLKSRFQSETEGKDHRISELVSHITTSKLEAEIVAALNKEGGSAALLLPVLKGMARVREVDGQWKTEVIGPDGNPRISTSSNGTDVRDMGIAELVKELKQSDDYARAFDGAGARGAGAKGSVGGGGQSRIDPNLTGEARLAAYRQRTASAT